MKKILSFILGTIVALYLSMSVAFSAANEVRVAFFLEWALPNQEDKVKETFKEFDKHVGIENLKILHLLEQNYNKLVFYHQHN